MSTNGPRKWKPSSEAGSDSTPQNEENQTNNPTNQKARSVDLSVINNSVSVYLFPSHSSLWFEYISPKWHWQNLLTFETFGIWSLKICKYIQCVRHPLFKKALSFSSLHWKSLTFNLCLPSVFESPVNKWQFSLIYVKLFGSFLYVTRMHVNTAPYAQSLNIINVKEPRVSTRIQVGFILSAACQKAKNENKSVVLNFCSICCSSGNYQLWIHNALVLEPAVFCLKSMSTFALCSRFILRRHFQEMFALWKHAELQSLLYISISPDSVLFLNTDYTINTGASVCCWSSEEKPDSRSISPPTLRPIRTHWFLFCSVTPPFHPHPIPVFHQIVTVSLYPLTASRKLCDSLITCFSFTLQTPVPPLLQPPPLHPAL